MVNICLITSLSICLFVCLLGKVVNVHLFCSKTKSEHLILCECLVGGRGGGHMHSSERVLPSDSSVVKNMKKKRDNLYVTRLRRGVNCVTSRRHEFRLI